MEIVTIRRKKNPTGTRSILCQGYKGCSSINLKEVRKMQAVMTYLHVDVTERLAGYMWRLHIVAFPRTSAIIRKRTA
jgi:hypothetical protein